VVVKRAERRRILHLEAVLPLEVDRVDRARGRDLGDERRRPGRLRVELEAHARRALEPAAQRLERRLLAETERVDEADGLRLEPEHVVQWAAGLAQREVERGRLERPPAKAPRCVPLRRLGPELERREVLAEACQCPLSVERKRRSGLVQRRAVLAERGDVFTQPVDAGADEPHVRRDALEVVCEDGVQSFVGARLDHDWKLREPGPQ